MTPAEAAIRAEIARRGPIPFSDFMALALGDPAGGYYTATAARPTRGGDFLTAPELHPIFGAVLGRQVAEAWERLGRPDAFTLLEYGAGAGTLALAILAGLRDDGSPLVPALRYAPVELNEHRLAELRERAAAAGLPLVDPGALDDAPAAGVVIANEFLDALPVHLVEIRDGRPREIHVGIGCDGAFEEVLCRALRRRGRGAPGRRWPAPASPSVRGSAWRFGPRSGRGRPRWADGWRRAWCSSSTTAPRPPTCTAAGAGPGR